MTNNRLESVGRAERLALLAAMVFPSLFTWLYFIGLRDAPPAVQQTVYTAGKLIQFAFPLIWVLAVRREKLHWQRPRRAGIVEGLVFGLLVAAVIVGGYYFWLGPLGWLDGVGGAIFARVSRFGVTGPAAFAAMGLFYCAVHSLLEEYYWRWFVFGRLRSFCSLPMAVLVGSLTFAAHHAVVLGSYFGHFGWMTWIFTLAVAIGGAAWCHIYHRSRSLWGPWLSHVLADAAIFSVGYMLVRAAAGW
jgi:uncharacterized protein